MTTILGIDNGLCGALAFYDAEELLIYDMPVLSVKDRKALDIHQTIKLITSDKPDHVYIEKTTPRPGFHSLTAYSMGHSEGIFEGLMAALQIPYTLVRPGVWKKAMGCPADKDAARQRATQLLPQFAHNWPRKRDDGRAESALIALYGLNKARRDQD